MSQFPASEQPVHPVEDLNSAYSIWRDHNAEGANCAAMTGTPTVLPAPLTHQAPHNAPLTSMAPYIAIQAPASAAWTPASQPNTSRVPSPYPMATIQAQAHAHASRALSSYPMVTRQPQPQAVWAPASQAPTFRVQSPYPVVTPGRMPFPAPAPPVQRQAPTPPPSPLGQITQQMAFDRIRILLVENLPTWNLGNAARLASRLTFILTDLGQRRQLGPLGLSAVSDIFMSVGHEGCKHYVCLAVMAPGGREVKTLLKGELQEKDGKDPMLDAELMEMCRKGFERSAEHHWRLIVFPQVG